jgi:hypothetical protein
MGLTELPPPATVDTGQRLATRHTSHLGRLLRNDATALVAIIIAGAVLRGIALDRPPIWGDEAMTFGRVCGTYRELVASLGHWGFVPLHFSLLWLIGQFALLRPALLRTPPAVFGALTVPALYWLGRELAGRRAALLVALLGACNAYLLSYSRDAKMYADFWLMVTLNVAALLWWLRVRNPLAWWAWVATGVAMLGLQLQGLMVLTLELLIVLSAPRANWPSLLWLLVLVLWLPLAALLVILQPLTTLLYRRNPKLGRILLPRGPIGQFMRRKLATFAWPPLALFIAGTAIALAAPIAYFTVANHYMEKIDTRGWRGTGLDWVGEYNEGRTAPELPLYTATAFLTSWEWPRASQMDSVNVRTRRLLCGSCIAIGALLALGVFPWRSRRRWARCAAPADSTDDHRPISDPGPLRWRPMLWLSIWIFLPAYGCYLLSLPRGVTPAQVHARPQDWLTALWELATAHRAWTIAASAIAALCVVLSASGFRRQAAGFGRIVLTIAVPLALCALLAWARVPLDQYAHQHWGSPWDEHESVWMPRYLAVSFPAVLLATALLLLRLPTRPVRIAAVAFLLIVNVSLYAARVCAYSEPPTDLIAADITASQNPNGSERTFCKMDTIGVGFGAPGSGLLHSIPMNYYLCIDSGKPSDPSQIFAVRDKATIYSPPLLFGMAIYVHHAVATNPNLRRVIVWDVLPPGQIDQTDKVLDALTGWRRVQDDLFPVRDHWTWRDLYVCRRRVYERAPLPPAPTAPLSRIPSTHPASAPATRAYSR